MGELTYPCVRDYVAKRRPEIWAAAGRAIEDAFVPQTHEPGAEAEVDFADLWVDLGGVRTKCFLFTLRLSFSGQGGAPGLLHRRAGGVPGGPRGRVRRAGRGSGRQDPLRQPQGRGLAGAVRAHPHRVRPLGRRSVRTTASTRSTASPASRARTRRAASRARAGGSAATTSSRSRRSTP